MPAHASRPAREPCGKISSMSFLRIACITVRVRVGIRVRVRIRVRVGARHETVLPKLIDDPNPSPNPNPNPDPHANP